MLDDVADHAAKAVEGVRSLRSEIQQLTEVNTNISHELEVAKRDNKNLQARLAKIEAERDFLRRFSDKLHLRVDDMYRIVKEIYEDSQKPPEQTGEAVNLTALEAEVKAMPSNTPIPKFLTKQDDLRRV